MTRKIKVEMTLPADMRVVRTYDTSPFTHGESGAPFTYGGMGSPFTFGGANGPFYD